MAIDVNRTVHSNCAIKDAINWNHEIEAVAVEMALFGKCVMRNDLTGEDC